MTHANEKALFRGSAAKTVVPARRVPELRRPRAIRAFSLFERVTIDACDGGSNIPTKNKINYQRQLAILSRIH